MYWQLTKEERTKRLKGRTLDAKQWPEGGEGSRQGAGKGEHGQEGRGKQIDDDDDGLANTDDGVKV